MDNIDRFSEIGFDIEEFGAMSVSVGSSACNYGENGYKTLSYGCNSAV